MNLEKLTGLELLYREGKANKIILQVPSSPFHVIFSYAKTTKIWKATLIELMGTKRKCLADNLSGAETDKLITKILTKGKACLFKHANKISQIKPFAEELITLIKPKKSYELQRNHLYIKRNRPRSIKNGGS